MKTFAKYVVGLFVAILTGVILANSLLTNKSSPDCSWALAPEITIQNCTDAIALAGVELQGAEHLSLAANHVIRGSAYFHKGRFDRAIADFDAALDLDQSAANVHWWRGMAYFRKGLYRRAIDDLKIVAANSPKSGTFYHLGKAYRELGETEQAKLAFQSVLSTTDGALAKEAMVEIQALEAPTEALPAMKISAVCAADEDADRKIAACKKLLQSSGANESRARAHVNLGLAYRQKKSYDDAIAEFSKAIAIDPDSFDAYYGKGYAHFLRGKYDEAIAELTKAIEIRPRSASSYAGRGWANYKKGQHDAAIADFDKAIELNPKSADSLNGRAWSYAKKKDIDHAMADINLAVAIDDSYRLSKAELQTALGLTTRVDKSAGHDKAATPERATGSRATGAEPALHDQCAHAEDDPDRQIDACTKIIEQNESKEALGKLYMHRAGAFRRKGEQDKAIADYEKAFALE